jgi:hypothetical protein
MPLKIRGGKPYLGVEGDVSLQELEEERFMSRMVYQGEKRELRYPFVMTVCDGEAVEVSEFESCVIARTFYEEEHLNMWAKVGARRWMKVLWALKTDGFYGRVAFEVSSLGWDMVPRPQEEFMATSYFSDWTGKTIDTEALQVFYAGFGFVARCSKA